MRLAAQLGVVIAVLGGPSLGLAGVGDQVVRVACLGDDVTAGRNVYGPTESYPAQLETLLGDGYAVGNFGLDAATLSPPAVPSVWQRFDEVEAFAPDIVVVALGANDTAHPAEPAGTLDHHAQMLLDRLADLPTAPRIVLCTPSAIVPETPELPPARVAELRQRQVRLEAIRRLLETVADRNVARRVELLDVFPLLDGRPELLTNGDGVRPNAAGHRVIAERVARRLRAPRPTIAVPSAEDRAAAAGWRGGGTWRDQHEEILRVCREQTCRVLLLGNSITQSWGGPGRSVWAPGQPAWDRHLAGLGVVNGGISGDRTEHLLWRIGSGLAEATTPEVVAVMIGTNNLPRDDAADIASGIEAVVDRTRAAWPSCRILLVNVPPRGKRPSASMRAKGNEVNRLVAPLDRRERLDVVEVADLLLRPDGSADSRRMRGDWIHLTEEGYEHLAARLAAALAEGSSP